MYKITNKDAELVTFRLNKAQQYLRSLELQQKKELWRARIIILKARQLGMTTYKVIDGLDDCLFKENQNIVITAHNQEKQQEIFAKAKLAYENIPSVIKDTRIPGGKRIKPKPKYDSKTEYYFEEMNSRIKVALDSRSGTPSALHITELAFKDNAREMMTGTLPAIPKSAPITIETTANWAGGYFFDMRKKHHNNPESDFLCVFIPWYTDEQYIEIKTKAIPEQLEFLKTFRKDNGELLTQEQKNRYVSKYEELDREVFQEFPSTPAEAFLTSGSPFYNVWVIRKLPVLEYTAESIYEWLRIYNSDQQRVLIWVDTAEWGADGDYSTIHVRGLDMKLLAAYQAKIPPDALVWVISYLYSLYGSWVVGIERNNTGLVTLTEIKNNPEYQYLIPFLYNEKTVDKYTNKITGKPGWLTTKSSRPILLAEHESAIRGWEITEIDERRRNESYTFVYNEKKKAEAMEWCHDDMIMSDAICYWMRKEPVRRPRTQRAQKPKRRSLLTRKAPPRRRTR